jgi:CubicO group peptidase (beta-lactamase class C family)
MLRTASGVRNLGLGAVLLGTLSLTAISQQAQITRPDGAPLTVPTIDSTVTQLIRSAHVTGAGVAIFNRGRVAYLNAYGLRDTAKKLPLTPDSVMTAASLSKSAFATVVMRLVQNGKLNLDKPIVEHLPKPLPDYPRYADLQGDDRYKKLTLRILLSHSSGLPNWRAFEDDRKLKFHFDPGTRFAYSGEGIDLAQLVVETVTGESLTSLMEQQLFQPQRMVRTSMVWQPAFDPDFANGYDEFGRSLGPEKRTAPDAAGSMQTTLRDYSRLLSAVMRHQVLNARTVVEMLSPQIAIKSAHQFPSLATGTSDAGKKIGLSYGLGWGLYTSPYGKAFFKEGHDEGWRNLALCFENGSGILIMTNSSNGEGIFKPLIDSLLGPTAFPFDWENYTPYNLLPPLPKLKERKPVSLTPSQMERFVGKYKYPPDIVLTVTVEEGHLYIQENDEPKQEFLADSPQNVYSIGSSDEYTFLPAAGQAQSLILHLEDKDLEFKRVP